MSKKLYAVVLDNNMIVADIIHGGIAIYENLKNAKIKLEQIYHVNKRNMLKQGIKYVVKKRYSIKEYVIGEPKQSTKWQKLKKYLEDQQNNFRLINKTIGKADYVLLSNCIKIVLSEMAKLEIEDEKSY